VSEATFLISKISLRLWLIISQDIKVSTKLMGHFFIFLIKEKLVLIISAEHPCQHQELKPV